MNEFLSICIPTYKRPEHMARLLSEFNACSTKVKALFKLHISDNSENTETELVVGQYINSGLNISYTRNVENIGMMANFEKVLGEADGVYLWLFGDDDQIMFSNSIEIICNLLAEKAPSYLILSDEESSKFGRSVIFQNATEYIKYAEAVNPDVLRCHTWITANVVKREFFDFEFASKMKHTEYMHMYGIFMGLKRAAGPVILYNERLVKTYAIIGYRDESFLDYFQLARKWIEFYGFLAEMFDAPRLNEFSKRWIY